MKDDEIDHNFAFGQTNIEQFKNEVEVKYNERSEEDIDYDQYKYAVGIKYDLKTR